MSPQPFDARQRILKKAQERFANAGYRKTTMSDIARDLGMSKKTLYNMFPSKLNLMEEVIDSNFAHIDSRSDTILASSSPAVKKLFDIMSMVAELQRSLVTNVMLESLRSDLPHLWARIERFRQERMRRNLEVILNEGERDGSVRGDVNHEMFYHFLLGALRNGLNPTVLMDASYSLHDGLVGLMDMLMVGLLTREGRDQYKRLQTASSRPLT